VPVRLDRAHLRHYAANGLFGFALANLVAYTALPQIPAGFFALLMPLVPILTVLGAALIGQERLTRRRIAGSALGWRGSRSPWRRVRPCRAPAPGAGPCSPR
jgi:drug/metabolite transporter (DMT)-like permease